MKSWWLWNKIRIFPLLRPHKFFSSAPQIWTLQGKAANENKRVRELLWDCCLYRAPDACRENSWARPSQTALKHLQHVPCTASGNAAEGGGRVEERRGLDFWNERTVKFNIFTIHQSSVTAKMSLLISAGEGGLNCSAIIARKWKSAEWQLHGDFFLLTWRIHVFTRLRWVIFSISPSVYSGVWLLSCKVSTSGNNNGGKKKKKKGLHRHYC